MSDASSVRYAATLPDPSRRNAGSIRFLTGTKQLVVSTGDAWEAVTTGLFETKVKVDALDGASPSAATNPVVGTSLWFVANREMTITAVKVGCLGAGSSLGVATMDITKVAADGVAAAGSILSAKVNLTDATGTVTDNSPALQALTATTARLKLVPGDSLTVTYAGTGKTAGESIGGTTAIGTVTATVIF